MQETLSLHGLVVKQSPIHGYGVFADKLFEPDNIIEECPVIFCDGKDNFLKNYYFDSPTQGKKNILPAGFGLLYNHADSPNAIYYFDEACNRLVFKSLCRIVPGEEILVYYGKKWFAERNLSVKRMVWWRSLLRFSTGVPFRALLLICALLLANQLLRALIVQ